MLSGSKYSESVLFHLEYVITGSNLMQVYSKLWPKARQCVKGDYECWASWAWGLLRGSLDTALEFDASSPERTSFATYHVQVKVPAQLVWAVILSPKLTKPFLKNFVTLSILSISLIVDIHICCVDLTVFSAQRKHCVWWNVVWVFSAVMLSEPIYWLGHHEKNIFWL